MPFSEEQLAPDYLIECMQILYAVCSQSLPEMGYCQGLNYFATTFNHVTNRNPSYTFSIILSILISKNLKGMYMSKVYEYHLKNHVLQKVIKEHLPSIYNHLVKKLQINIEMITTQWIMTMFVGWLDKEEYLIPMFDQIIL